MATKRKRAKAKPLEPTTIIDSDGFVELMTNHGKGPSEGSRLLALECGRTSVRAVCKLGGWGWKTVQAWLENDAKPRQEFRQLLFALLAIPVSSWEQEPLPAPPPPTAEEILEGLRIKGSFLEFLTEGPPQFPATPQQRVLIKVVFDDIDPADLNPEERAISNVLFGDIDYVPKSARRKAVLRLGRESAKSTITAAYAVYRLLTADISRTFKNTLPSVVFFSSDAETTKTIFDMASEFLKDIKLAREKTEVDNLESIVFTRPTDGRRVRLRAIVRSAGGVRGRGFPIVAAVVDEAEFMRSAKEDAVIKDEHVIEALLFRMTIGAKILLLSTPWEEESYAGGLFDQNFGKPTTALAALGQTLFLRDNDPAVAALREELMLTDPIAAAREFDVKVVSMGNALIPGELVDAAVARYRSLACTPKKQRVSAGVDLGLRRDRSTLVLTERQGSVLVVTGVHERTPRPGRPLSGTEVCGEFAQITKDAGGRHMTGDNHRGENLRDAALDVGMEVVILENKPEETATYLSSLFRENRIAIPDHPRLIKQIKAVRTRAKPGGGLEIVRPRTKELGHCDLEAGLECAAWADKRHGSFPDTRTGLRYPGRLRGGFTT
jgi:hypothetical protein